MVYSNHLVFFSVYVIVKKLLEHSIMNMLDELPFEARIWDKNQSKTLTRSRLLYYLTRLNNRSIIKHDCLTFGQLFIMSLGI